MDGLLKDLRFALRTRRKNSAFLTIAVPRRALRIGVNLASAFALVVTFGACVHAGAISAPNRGNADSFEARRARAASGRLLDSTQLGDRPDLPLVEVLSARIAGFGVARGARLATSLSDQCTLDVFVDGAPSLTVDNLRAHDVAAVEYYEAATAPFAYRRNGRVCPILLVWLRH